MNLYVKQAIKHYQDNLNRFNRIAADCVDMLTSDKSTDRLEWYLKNKTYRRYYRRIYGK